MDSTINSITERLLRDFPIPQGSGSALSSSASTDPLTRNGYGDPNCPVCHGIGFIRAEKAVGEAGFGRMEPCVCRREELDRLRSRNMVTQSNLTPYKDMTFENFNLQGRGGYREEHLTLLRYARDQAHNFAVNPQGWLFLSGPYGAGKTHLAAAIANSLLNRGVSVIFQPVPNLLDFLRGGYRGTDESYEERFQRVCDVPLLVLDDLGTQNATGWAEEKLYQIINHRYVEKLPTVVTTNNDLRSIDGRITSRLLDPMVLRIILNVPDYRDSLSANRQENDISILHMLGEKSFDNFKDRRTEQLSPSAVTQLARAVNECRAFAAEPNGWLVLAGPNGVGKTHLAAAIGNERKDSMDTPMMMSAPDLLDHLRSTFSPNSNTTYDSLFEQVRNTQLLILLNMDTLHASPWAKEKMIQLLNHRYYAQLPTVITLSKTIQELDPAISSRIVDAKFCDVIPMYDVPMYSYNPEINLKAVYPSRGNRRSNFK